jgi:hypothetical protein
MADNSSPWLCNGCGRELFHGATSAECWGPLSECCCGDEEVFLVRETCLGEFPATSPELPLLQITTAKLSGPSVHAVMLIDRLRSDINTLQDRVLLLEQASLTALWNRAPGGPAELHTTNEQQPDVDPVAARLASTGHLIESYNNWADPQQ